MIRDERIYSNNTIQLESFTLLSAITIKTCPTSAVVVSYSACGAPAAGRRPRRPEMCVCVRARVFTKIRYNIYRRVHLRTNKRYATVTSSGQS